ncbi:MAG: hypothetical protein ACREM1_17460 [Longimicrobiales bacterium]
MADGSRRAVETRADGTFAVPASATSVVISHVGYTTRAVVLDSTGELTVRLDASPLQLDQVTVTATRAAKRLEDAPGSVSVIGRASLDTRSIARVDQAVGMTSGVYNHRPNVLDDGHGSSRTPSTRLTQTRRPGRTDPRKSSCADTISRNSRLPRRRCLPRERCCCYASRPC